MKHFPVSWKVLTVVMTCANAVIADNPLATPDQKELDALAIKLNQKYDFVVLKAEAKVAYQTAHGLPISDAASSRLDAAIDELAFSALQKAINTDPYHPKAYWVDAGPRSWFDLDVPGGRDPNSQNTVAHLSGSDLVIEDDGSYTITINSSSADGAKNHIQSTSSGKQLFVRNNLGDWQSEKPDNISVVLVDDASGQDPISESKIISTARWNLQESIVDYGVGALGIKTMINKLNTLKAPSQSSTLGTLTSQASSFGHFKLGDQEALVATVTQGDADYFVFPWTDPWMITTEPGYSQVSLNNIQASVNDNGTYTFVVSLEDPGVYNWINTTGLYEGTAMFLCPGLDLFYHQERDS
ncbi:hypothetical protein N7481_001002 [Penicillium waksmanii]|uniref:uncharacterized protein n=1 Tax=Penicillium waksmanii TaxID=69791 RepID=UPI0025496B42|nr:uncharacterized protein N7481_001002 [Penicillium waksmanii]KAJ6000593.1 hypothetical protein N7481_001002 [Penicillium waksmanii]